MKTLNNEEKEIFKNISRKLNRIKKYEYLIFTDKKNLQSIKIRF